MADIKDIAARVRSNPKDASGWLELAGALSVMGREKEAEYSRAQAQKLLQVHEIPAPSVPSRPAGSLPPLSAQPLRPADSIAHNLPNALSPYQSSATKLKEKAQPVVDNLTVHAVELKDKARPVYLQAKQSSLNVLASFLAEINHYAPIFWSWVLAKTHQYVPILVSRLVQGLSKLGHFIVKFLFRGSGTIPPLLRLYYISNLFLTPIFLYMFLGSGQNKFGSANMNLLIGWVLFAILADSRARKVAWKSGRWLASFLFQAIGGLGGDIFALIAGLIACILIFCFALALGLVLGSIMLWISSVYALGKDALYTAPASAEGA